MAVIISGLTPHGGLRSFAGSFLMFSEYARNALGMAALMKINPIMGGSFDGLDGCRAIAQVRGRRTSANRAFGPGFRTSGLGRTATISRRALSTELSSGVASLPLTAYREYEDRVELLDVAVQSYVATGAASDDQLPRVCGYGSSDKRIVMEYVDSLNDFPDTARRIFNSVLREMLEDAIEVILDLRSQLDPGHPQGASFLATGRATVFPAIRSSR